ncbi:hypothetical protein E3J38_01980 [candidate division TA06 bacterium]|uniref:Uncharacterized protein n=1 Tax=candidate division TA06 bacterium TaxID=2250710 RepID=A0A523XTF7_UNCT6|nr:MAG: hypothetical protein E3J38_01980 [candidate division TA06 bacterium]
MREKQSPTQFTDKVALLFLLLLSDPERKWHVHDFRREGISMGWASEILSALHDSHLVEREYRGKFSYTTLVSPQRLIGTWTERYSFSMNRQYSFRSVQKNILSELKTACKKEKKPPYALTLHTGANLLAPYVKSPAVHAYLEAKSFGRTLAFLKKALDLRQVMDGGTIHFYEPFCKEAVFKNTRILRGFRVVSNLQLYLDLFHHGLRGYEHSTHLKHTLEERRISLWSK